jgi:hypothetical protein
MSQESLSDQQRQEQSDARNERIIALIYEVATLISEGLSINEGASAPARLGAAPAIRRAPAGPTGFAVGDRVRVTNRVVIIPPPQDRSRTYNVGVITKITDKRIHIRLDEINKIIVRKPSNVERALLQPQDLSL